MSRAAGIARAMNFGNMNFGKSLSAFSFTRDHRDEPVLSGANDIEPTASSEAGAPPELLSPADSEAEDSTVSDLDLHAAIAEMLADFDQASNAESAAPQSSASANDVDENEGTGADEDEVIVTLLADLDRLWARPETADAPA